MTTQSPSPLHWLGLRRWGFAVAVIAAAGAGAALYVSTSDNALRQSFSTALQSARPGPAVQHAASEDYWLGALRPNGPSPAVKTVTVGDRISMTLSGAQRNFAVTSVAEFSPEVTTVDTKSTVSRFVLVTAQDIEDAGAKPIRFVLEIEAEPANIAARRVDRAS